MNNRIQELIEKATESIEVVNPDTGITHHREFFDREKYTQLLIQECCQLIEVWEKDSRNHISYMLREHFKT